MRQVTGAPKPRSCTDTPGFATGAACSLADALASARSVAGEADRVEILVEIWKVQVSVGDGSGAGRTMDEALAFAGVIDDVDDRACALAYMARNQGSRGDAEARRTVAGAIGIAGEIRDGRDRDGMVVPRSRGVQRLL